MRKGIRVFVASLALGGSLLAAGPASAQPVVTGGLVNVTVTDVANNVLSNNRVGLGVAAGIAADVCGVQVPVAVLGTVFSTAGGFTCTSSATGNTVHITQ